MLLRIEGGGVGCHYPLIPSSLAVEPSIYRFKFRILLYVSCILNITPSCAGPIGALVLQIWRPLRRLCRISRQRAIRNGSCRSLTIPLQVTKSLREMLSGMFFLLTMDCSWPAVFPVVELQTSDSISSFVKICVATKSAELCDRSARPSGSESQLTSGFMRFV